MFFILSGGSYCCGFVFPALKNIRLLRFAMAARIGGVIVCLIGAMYSMLAVVHAGQVGVKTLYGKGDDQDLYSGLNVVNPLVKVTAFDFKTQNFTMSAIHDEGSKSGDDAIRILTADGLEVTIGLSILF